MEPIKSERKKQTVYRIHRIQGQLTALEQSIEADLSCEELVIQARAIEKAVSSLITHMFEGYLLHQMKAMMQDNTDQAIQEISRIFKLINR
jgi:DNA-binding FrmR family transcriptional regulator